MRKMVLLAVGVAATAVAVPAFADYLTRPSDNQLGETLRRFGFLPIALPTEQMSVGSLYYVDSRVRFFHVICRADPADLKDNVDTTRGGIVKETLLRNGRFATDVKVDVGGLVKVNGKRDYNQVVHYSLTDVHVEEIALDKNAEIFAKLMSKPSCNSAVMGVIYAGGYVCQGQKTLRATAEFKLDSETESGIATNTNAELKERIKLAIETQSEQRVVEKHGSLQSGSALKYGVAMNPVCMAPPDGRFRRVLPETMYGRMTNFMLFRVVEAIWPVGKL